jgi:hypothetical protein
VGKLRRCCGANEPFRLPRSKSSASQGVMGGREAEARKWNCDESHRSFWSLLWMQGLRTNCAGHCSKDLTVNGNLLHGPLAHAPRHLPLWTVFLAFSSVTCELARHTSFALRGTKYSANRGPCRGVGSGINNFLDLSPQDCVAARSTRRDKRTIEAVIAVANYRIRLFEVAPDAAAWQGGFVPEVIARMSCKQAKLI